MSNTDFNNFQYVVDYNIKNPICFGTKLTRNTNLIGKNLNNTLAPGCYNVEKYKTIDRNRGVLFNKDMRFKSKNMLRTPSPTRYYKQQISWNSCRIYRTFEKQLTRKINYTTNTPGPGTYEIRPIFGKHKHQQHVETICTPILTHICSNCNELCNYDYWHQDYSKFLCHNCWLENKSSGQKDYIKFKKIRNCSFKHQHDGTNAALQLLPKRQLIKKIRLENYLNQYIHC